MKTKNKNKIAETTLVQPKQAPQVFKYQDWVKKNFNDFDSKKCLQTNQALLICVNSKCTKQNPFICNAKKCQCMISHKLCSMRNYESFLQEINSKKSISSKIQDKVEILMDNLVDIISEMKQFLLKKLRQDQGQFNNFFLKDQEKLRQKQLQNLVKQKITGSLILKIYEFGSQSFKEENLQKFFLLLKKIIINFQQNQLDKLKLDIKKLLFSEMNVYWNQNQKFSQMQVRGKKFTHTGNHSQIKISFIEPNVAKFPGNIIKWRIKMQNQSKNSFYVQPWIAMGIGFKKILKNSDYIFNKEKNESCYMISNDGFSFAAFDLKKDNMKGFGFQFNSWSTVEIELDKIKWEIKFRKVNSSQQTKLKILLQPQSQADSYNICVGSSSFGNSVEILSVQTQFGVFLK